MKKILFSLLAAVALTGCTHENDDTKLFSNFATLDVVTSKGAVLSVQSPGESQVYTLTASQDINAEAFSAGSRVFIQYTTPTNTNTSSQNCTLQAMFNTQGNGAEIMSASAETTDDWESAEVQINEVSITGHYINIIGRANCTYDKFNCQLYVDAATVNDDYPQLYLVFTNEGFASDYLTLLGSWSFEQLLQSGNCKGLTLHANNPNYGSIRIDFN